MAYFTKDDLDMFKSALSLNSNKQVSPQPVKKSKNFLEDNISTLGSMGGSLGGAALGASVGSIVPGVGTAIGGLLGAILGGAGGGAVGQVAENAITGDNLGTDVGSEALWGGLTSLPLGATGKLLKAGGTVVKGLGSDVAKTAAKDLVQEAGAKTIGVGTLGRMTANGKADDAIKAAMERISTSPTLANKASTKLSGAADDLAVKQFRLTPTQLANYSKKFGEDAGQTIRKYGFTSAEDIASKGIDPLQTQFSDLVTNAGAISKDTLKKNFDNAVSELAKSNSSTNRAIGEQLKRESDALLKKYGDAVPASKVNEIRREFDSLVNYTQSIADPNKYGVNKRVADVLRKTLQEADTTGQLKNVGNEISKLKQLSDVVAKQGELGRGSLPLNIPSLMGSIAGTGVGGIPGGMLGFALTNAANSQAGRKVMMGLADKAASKLTSEATNTAGQTLKQLGTRGAATAASKGIVGAMMGNQSSDLNNTAVTTPTMNMSTMPTNVQNMGTSYTKNTQSSSPFGYSAGQLGQALMAAYSAGDTKAAAQLEKMYTLASEYETAQAKAAASSTDAGYSKPSASQYSQGVTAMQSLDSLNQLLQDNPGLVNANAVPGQGIPVVGGLISSVAGTGQYRALTKNILNSIARINTGANMPESEVQFYEQTYLPQPGDTEATKAQKLANLRQFFTPIVNYKGGGTSANDLLSAIASSGY